MEHGESARAVFLGAHTFFIIYLIYTTFSKPFVVDKGRIFGLVNVKTFFVCITINATLPLIGKPIKQIYRITIVITRAFEATYSLASICV